MEIDGQGDYNLNSIFFARKFIMCYHTTCPVSMKMTRNTSFSRRFGGLSKYEKESRFALFNTLRFSSLLKRANLLSFFKWLLWIQSLDHSFRNWRPLRGAYVPILRGDHLRADLRMDILGLSVFYFSKLTFGFEDIYFKERWKWAQFY